MTSDPSSQQPNSNTEDADSTAQQDTVEETFPIVGVAASAGGLEAFIQLLSHLPTDTGMAFVLIQHLSPDHESLLSEILTRATQLPVREVQNGMTVEPNQVYVALSRDPCRNRQDGLETPDTSRFHLFNLLQSFQKS